MYVRLCWPNMYEYCENSVIPLWIHFSRGPSVLTQSSRPFTDLFLEGEGLLVLVIEYRRDLLSRYLCMSLLKSVYART